MVIDGHEDVAEYDGVHVVQGTAKALLVEFMDGQQRWVPKSVIHDDSEVFDEGDNASGKLVLHGWFVEKNWGG